MSNAASRALVIVESPTKARTIRKFLGENFIVEASMGHVRDLPSKAAEVPAEIKGEKWARMSVDVDNGYQPYYVVSADKKKIVSTLKSQLKGVDAVYLATDEDREGESIGWHLKELLNPKVPTYRMVFHEITREAILHAIEHPRQLDQQLVQAQEARRVLDRLVGYEVSPLLWKKVRPKLSAGRVQSVAVRLLVQRERERMSFQVGHWWDLRGLVDREGLKVPLNLISVGEQRIASGADFDERTGQLQANKKVRLLDEAQAKALAARLQPATLRVAAIERKQSQRTPYPPFTTSTLQQEANRKLGLSARNAMQVAQRLYENGHITYMRTDSVNLSEGALGAVRTMIQSRYGERFLSPQARRYTTKSKGAQEAHEAIRPAGTEMRTAQELGLTGPEASLYDLIWKRTVATQMANAIIASTSVNFEGTDPEGGDTVVFRATGREVLFPGFFRAYVEGTDDPSQALDDRDSPLPTFVQDEQVRFSELAALGHETRPPARFTEATLVKELERLGIGRPSTYASIIDTIQKRDYVVSQARQLVPTFTAMAVTALLERTLEKIVDVDFTATMEAWLDKVAEGEDYLGWLDHFYREELIKGVRDGEAVEAREVCTIKGPQLEPFHVRLGRFGPYVEYLSESAEEQRSLSLPEGLAPADVDRGCIEELIEKADRGEQPLGYKPGSGEAIYVKQGRFGPYVQLGEATEEIPKPHRVSLLAGQTPETLDLETALNLLALPRLLGEHPETQAPIRAGLGRFGPYVVHEKTYASLKKTDDVLTVDLERALQLLAEKQSRGGGRAAATPLRVLGAHPESGEEIGIFSGRYGPYVKHDGVNASLPKDEPVEDFTLEAALALLAQKAKAPKKTAAKKAPAKKAAAEGEAPKKTTRKAPAKKTAASEAAEGEAPKKTTRKAAPKKAAASEAAEGEAPSEGP